MDKSVPLYALSLFVSLLFSFNASLIQEVGQKVSVEVFTFSQRQFGYSQGFLFPLLASFTSYIFLSRLLHSLMMK